LKVPQRTGFLCASASRELADANSLAIALFTAASAILLAWSASLCLSAATHRTSGPVQHFTIFVSGSGKVSGNATLVRRLLLDGKAPRQEDLGLKGEWVSLWDRTLSHPNTLEPAAISFNARSAVVLFDRLDNCGHLSISGQDGPIWKDECGHGADVVALDLPAQAPSPRWSFALWLVTLLAFAVAARPWRSSRRLEAWLLTYLILIHLLFWLTQPVGLLTDSLGQIATLKMNVLQGAPEYFPPGYPILIGVGYLISSTVTGSIITMLQHLMMIATIWWAYKLMERCAGATIAYATALIIGAAAPTLMLPQGLLSENVALFGMMGALYFAFNYRGRGQLRDGVLAGLLLGWAALARIMPLAAGLPAVFAIMMGAESWTAGLRKFAIVLAPVCVMLLAPILCFGIRSGKFALTNSIGRHLYNRTVSDQDLLDRQAPATSRLLELIAPIDPYGVRHWDVQKLLKKKGLTRDQIEALMKQTSIESIHHAPREYIMYSLHQAWIQYFLDPRSFMPYASTPFEYNSELEPPPLLGACANSLMWRERLEDAFGNAWKYVPWIALASIALLPLLKERATFLAFALTPAAYILSTAFVEYLLSRYNAALIPFVLMMAGGTVAAMIRLLARFRGAMAGGDPGSVP
jgi:hypothetical protein